MIAAILITVALAPILLLGAFILADRFGLKIAGPILDWTMIALIGQWRIGCLVNIGLGLALIAGGLYFIGDFGRTNHWIAALFMTSFGLWRVWRGVTAWPRSDETAP